MATKKPAAPKAIRAQIKIDYRAGPGGRMKAKIEAIEDKLGRKLST